NGANPTLGERVQIRAPWRKCQTINAAGSQHVIKFRRELRIAVMDQAAMVAEPAGCLVDRIAGHLNHPRLYRMPGQTSECHPPALQIQEEEDVINDETAPCQDLDGEE